MQPDDSGVRAKVLEYTERFGARALETLEQLVGRSSAVPDTRYFRTDGIAWIEHLEANWKTMRRELDDVLAYRQALPSFQEISTDQHYLTEGDDWKTFFLYGFGFRSEPNCARCPETAALVETIPGMQTAFFSILAPHKHIPDHRGPYKGLLRYHLALKIPEPPELCRIDVGGEVRTWDEGKSLLFDDTYVHEAWNDSDEVRVVLFVDLVRPVRPPAEYLNHALIAAIKWSPYVGDAKRRHLDWEARFENLRRATDQA
jgi:aspartyl/asparaginyl beta-hydroxylase (cupin superfamily)